MQSRDGHRLWKKLFGIAVAAAVTASAVAGFQLARGARARSGCESNLRQIGLALVNYASRANGYPYGTYQTEGLPAEKRLSWFVGLSPDMDQWHWFFDTSKPWDDDVNLVTRGRGVVGEIEVVRNIPLFSCPAASHPPKEPMPCLTSYAGLTGLGQDSATLPPGHPRIGVFGYDRQTLIAEIKDGMATTMAVIETAERGPWTAGGTHTLRAVDPEHAPYLGRGRPFGGNHRGGAMVLFADGSVHFVRESINPKTFEALSTIAGGEPLPAGWAE